jgi:hypothetical protein
MATSSPSVTSAPLLVGRSRDGQWIVRDRSGRHGGMFVTRAAALGYVRLVTGVRAPAVVMVAGGLELDILDVS